MIKRMQLNINDHVPMWYAESKFNIKQNYTVKPIVLFLSSIK